MLDEKISHPFNTENKKVIIFTAFADTAKYLYKELAKYIKDTYVAEGQDLAMIDYISLPQKVRETSIENFENVSVTIFPNPTSNYVNIDIKNCNFSIKQIEVLDVYGKLIKKESFSGNSGKIDMSNLSQGLYMLIIRQESKILNINKIVKK